MNWKDEIKKDFKDRMGGRMSRYGNTPKTQEIRKKLKQLRKEMLDAFDATSNNTSLEEFEPVLPKITSLIQEMRRVDGMQQTATTANVERKRNERNAQVLGQ
jgi:hypothetical protein